MPCQQLLTYRSEDLPEDVRTRVRELAQEARATARSARQSARKQAVPPVEETPGARRGGGRKPPRRRDAEATKAAILEAARHAFAHGSYDQVGLRNIAARARVDVALVGRYFGSKEDLFEAAITAGKPPPPPTDLPARAEFGVWLARRVLSLDDSDPTRLLVLHHAVGNAGAAAVVRKMVMERFIRPVGAFIGGPDGELRASLIYSLLAGFGMMGRLVKLEPIAATEKEALVAHVGRAIQAYFDGAEG
ncbi:MAG: TetR family transcriptional regulator [Bauldia sp.]|nr:TetR family transcriptional regulator [Bauldia sp.]